MARRYNLRSIEAVASSIRFTEAKEDLDINSDQENLSIADSSTESEQSESASSEREGLGCEHVASKRSKKSNDARASTRGRRKSVVTGKNGHRWFYKPRERVSDRNNSITSFLPGPIGEARTAHTPLEIWSLLLTDEILNIVVLHSNEEIERYCREIEVEQLNTYRKIDLIELKAFIGLLYCSGLQKTNGSNVEDLWSADLGTAMYRATMPLPRFKFIYKCLRFDDKTTREARKQIDKFAPIRELWSKFITRCTQLYNPASYCTIDEQLLSFRGRCPFKVYNGSKPDKYGIKVVMLNDARTFYMYTAIPYTGKVITEPSEKIPSYYVRKLSEPIHGTVRNITCDNWFSSIEIFDKMLQNHGITMVGTLRKNKREIPSDFKKAGQPGSTKYVFDATKTLISFTPKKNKVVLVLSTFHQTESTDPTMNKPAMIAFYNATKSGTDTFDQLCHEYTTARKTRRWPMRFFFGMLDQCSVNSVILYNFNSTHATMSRREFNRSLVHNLIKPHLERRRLIPTLRRDILLSIQSILGLSDAPFCTSSVKEVGKLIRCVYCPRTLDRKTRVRCSNCNIPVCEVHRQTLCGKCLSE